MTLVPACNTVDGTHSLATWNRPGSVQEAVKGDTPETPTKIARNSQPQQPSILPQPNPGGVVEEGKPFAITLSAALSLAGSNALDVQIADERVRLALAQLDQAKVQWLPNINVGIDYFRHDGQIQDIVGTVFTTSRSSLLVGAGPQAVVGTSDAVFAPLIARQVVHATQSDAHANRNDVALAVAEAYCNVQQARGDVAGGVESLRRAEDLVARTARLAPDLAPELEVNRAKTEASRRRQAVESAYERWQVASAELVRLLRLRPGTLVEPVEDPATTWRMVDPETPLDELIAKGLSHRPELAAHQALIQAALIRVRQENQRFLYPTLAIRGVGSNTTGLAGGLFGGGVDDDLQDFNTRFSVDLQAVWELRNLGWGNRAQVQESQAHSRRTILELLRTQDRVTADIVQARAQIQRADKRLHAAAEGVIHAVATAQKNLEGLGQTKRAGEQLILVFRPQEAVSAVAALDQAFRDFYQAVADHNRAHFRLFRAIGSPPVDRSVINPMVANTSTTDKNLSQTSSGSALPSTIVDTSASLQQ